MTDSSLLKNRWRKIPRVLLVLVALLGAGAGVCAQGSKLSGEKRAAIEKAVSRFMAANNVPGVAVAVVLDGAPAWSEGFGMADLENYVPVTPSTLFRLGSISKPITATAAMQLFERGKLDLDAEVQKYCPAFPKKEWPITTRELLGHLSGIRHYNRDGKGDIPEDSAKHFATMEEALQVFANDPLLSKPGAQFHYSTYGYTVAGCVLEGAASQKYVDYVRENVFRPAGMEQTRDDNYYAVIPHRTRFYHKDQAGVVRNAGVLDSSYKIPGGGLISSGDDLALFEAAILNDKLMKRATRDVMWTPQKPADGSRDPYALGWGMGSEFGLEYAAHTGSQQGTSTGFLLVPKERAGVVVLANMDGVDAGGLADELVKIVFEITEKKP